MLISLSADDAPVKKFKKGQRVIAKVGRSQYHVGTVKSAGAKGTKVVFDDELVAVVEPGDYGDLHHIALDTPETPEVLKATAAKALIKAGKTAVVTAVKGAKGALKRLIPNR